MEELLAAFDSNGYLHLRAAIDQDELCVLLQLVANAERLSKAEIIAKNAQDFGSGDDKHPERHQLNHPVSRIVDHDPRFGRYFDHPSVRPLLQIALGDYRHIDNDLYCEFVYHHSCVGNESAAATVLTSRGCVPQTRIQNTAEVDGTAAFRLMSMGIGLARTLSAQWSKYFIV